MFRIILLELLITTNVKYFVNNIAWFLLSTWTLHNIDFNCSLFRSYLNLLYGIATKLYLPTNTYKLPCYAWCFVVYKNFVKYKLMIWVNTTCVMEVIVQTIFSFYLLSVFYDGQFTIFISIFQWTFLYQPIIHFSRYCRIILRN